MSDTPLFTAAAQHPVLYGLDIETDTATGGLDPCTSRVLAVGITGHDFSAAFTGDEHRLLSRASAFLADLPAGVVVTWNGSGFDLPFLSDRAARVGLQCRSNRFGLSIAPRGPDPDGHAPLAGHHGRYRGRWHHHDHLDAYLVYRNDMKRTLDVSCSLKSIAALVGVDVVAHDASRVHELDRARLSAYVLSDARAARALAMRRWATASRFLDSERPQRGGVAQRGGAQR